MDAENIICLVILIICTLPFIVLGIVQMRSKRPVGFWSGERPPEVARCLDTAAYNRKHGVMWIIYGAGILPSFLIGAFLGGNGGAAIGVTAECCGGIIVMIFYHNYLYRKYIVG